MYHNSILIFFYCGGITSPGGMELDSIQDKRKGNTGYNEVFLLGKKHDHLTTNPDMERCTYIHEYYQ